MFRSMRNRPLPPPITIIALAAIIGFDVAAAALAWNALRMPLPITASTSFSLPVLPLLPATDRGLPERKNSIALARPLFSPSRRPFEPPLPQPAPAPIVQAPPPPPIPELIVDGIWLQGTTRRAYLRTKNGEAGDWRAEGDLRDGWRIVSITASNVTIVASGRTVILEMYPPLQVDAE
jgi:hypothetical protein